MGASTAGLESWKCLNTMKVLRLHGAQDLRLHEEPVPTSGPEEVLLKVTAVGVCGSDLHWFAEQGIGADRLSRALVLGHEFAGIIQEGPRRGERVAVDPAMPCGACEYCLQGNPNICPEVRFAGHGATDGALREYIAWPERNLYTLPESLSDIDGAMLEPLGVAIHTVDLGHVKSGMSVAVLGCGPIGLLTIQMARLAGATPIYATDKLAHRLEAARSGGAIPFSAQQGGEAAEILRATHGRGVDVAFEAAGENDAVQTAVAVARPGGQVVLAGIPADDDTTFTASTARRKGLTLRLVRRMKHTYPRSIRLAEAGLVDLRSLVTGCFRLEQSLQAFQMANDREGIKLIIQP